jgi:ribose transport system substrate-binding protein
MHQVPWRRMAPAAIAALALTAAGCGSDTDSSVGGGSAGAGASTGGGAKANALPASCKKDRPVLGVALPNTVNPYYVAMRQSFLDNAKKAGFDVRLAIANDSDSNQLNQITTFVQQQVCAVALNAVNSGPGAASAALLNRAKIPVFTVNVIVSPDDLKRQKAEIQQYVGADQVEGGKAMGEEALKDLGKDAKITYGIVGDPEQIPTNQRDGGFKGVLKANPNARFVGVVNSKVDPQISLTVATDMLQGNPDMNVVFADTGPGAVGAIQAIKSLKRSGKTTLYGFCAADTPLDSTLYRGCAAQEPADYARIVVENVAKYVKGSAVPKEILRPLKIFGEGQKPAAGEVG